MTIDFHLDLEYMTDGQLSEVLNFCIAMRLIQQTLIVGDFIKSHQNKQIIKPANPSDINVDIGFILKKSDDE